MLGSLLIGLAPTGDLATAFLLTGRALQTGLVGGLHHAGQPGAGEDLLGWSGASARGEPVVHRLLGRFRRLLAVRRLHGPELGWRYIFFSSIIVSVIGLLMIKGTPDSKA